MEIIQQEMTLPIYWLGNQPYIHQTQLEGLGFKDKVKPNMPGNLQPFSLNEIEEMVGNYRYRNPDILLTTEDMEYPAELKQQQTTPYVDSMITGMIDVVNRAGFGDNSRRGR